MKDFLNGLGPSWLPFAEATSADLPAPRLLRLGLFQVTVGMALALLGGTLNRVMIVELGMSAWLVGSLLAIPMVLAPLRALLGHRSDHHRSTLGWRRVPYLWFGTLLQFGGLAILPFSLLLLEQGGGLTEAQQTFGFAGGALAFVLIGLGAHTVQTSGLALATDLSTEERRPKVVALLYVTFLAGLMGGSLIFSWTLRDFTSVLLVKVIQGSAVATVLLNGVALWKQEALPSPEAARAAREARDRGDTGPSFREAWRNLMGTERTPRLLVAVGLGSAGFAMQDVLLEPYGGQIMALGVGATSLLTALGALGGLAAFGLAARRLSNGVDPLALAAWGALAGIFAFAAVVLAAPLHSPNLLRVGSAFIGFGGGLFAVGTLTAAMNLKTGGESGIVVGAWGAVQATSAGAAVGLGGLLRDGVTFLASERMLGPGLTGPESGYMFVYHLEILALFLAIAALGPMVSPRGIRAQDREGEPQSFGLAEMPS